MVPHHGSGNSSSIAFYRTVDIDVYLISCGRHKRFQFPSIKVLDAINQATTTKEQRIATIVLTNGIHLNNHKMKHETDMWINNNITISYWDEHIYNDQPWLDYCIYPTDRRRLITDNLIDWSINGYKQMASMYSRCNRKRLAVIETTTNRCLSVNDNEEVLLLNGIKQTSKISVITDIPSPDSPCDWERTLTLALTGTLNERDDSSPVFLQFSHVKCINGIMRHYFTLCRCHQLPWLIQYAYVVNGTIKWRDTTYNGLQVYKNIEMALFYSDEY